MKKHEFDRPATEEERALGLDPSKFTRKPWNPKNYIGKGYNNSENPYDKVEEVVQEVKPAQIPENKYLNDESPWGPGGSQFSAEEIKSLIEELATQKGYGGYR